MAVRSTLRRAIFLTAIAVLSALPVCAQHGFLVTALTNDGARDWKAFGSGTQDLLAYESLTPYGSSLWLRSVSQPELRAELEIEIGSGSQTNPYGLRGEWFESSRAFLVPLSDAGNYDIHAVSLANLLRSNIFERPWVRVGRVSRGDEWEGDLAISPDGRLMAYVRGSSRGGALVVSRTNGRSLQTVYNADGAAFAPAWSPSGRLLCYSVNELERAYVVVSDLSDDDGVVLPDLSYAVFRTEDTVVAYRDHGLVAVSLTDRQVRPIAQDVLLEEGPALSSDGTLLAFTRVRDSGRDVFLYDFATGSEYRVPVGVPLAQRPVWVPESRHLLVEGFRGVQWDLYRVEVANDR